MPPARARWLRPRLAPARGPAPAPPPPMRAARRCGASIPARPAGGPRQQARQRAHAPPRRRRWLRPRAPAWPRAGPGGGGRGLRQRAPAFRFRRLRGACLPLGRELLLQGTPARTAESAGHVVPPPPNRSSGTCRGREQAKTPQPAISLADRPPPRRKVPTRRTTRQARLRTSPPCRSRQAAERGRELLLQDRGCAREPNARRGKLGLTSPADL